MFSVKDLTDELRAAKSPEILIVKDPFTGVEAPLGVLPPNYGLKDVSGEIDKYRPHPVRSKACTSHLTLDSFLEHVAAFGPSGKTVIYADSKGEKISLTAYYDHDPLATAAGKPGWHENRAVYNAPLSPEWERWAASDKQAMNQAGMAEFMEENAMNVLPPDSVAKAGIVAKAIAALGGPMGGPQDLLTVSRGIQVHEGHTAAASIDLSTGAQSIQWTVENKVDKVLVPKLFVLAIPVLKGGSVYQVPVRLRYAMRGGIMWTYALFGRDAVFQDVVDGVLEKLKGFSEESGVPVFEGTLGR